ncbi:probable serine/threonine-protein kinase PBL19 [Tanacetum coccineum]
MCNSAKSGGQMKSAQANKNALKAAEAVVPRLMKHLSLQLRKHLQSEQGSLQGWLSKTDGDSCSKKRGIDETAVNVLATNDNVPLSEILLHPQLRQTSSKAKEIYNSSICCHPILKCCLRKCSYTTHLMKQTSVTGFGPSTQMLRNTKRNCHTVSVNSLSDTYPPNILQCRYRLLACVSSFHAEDGLKSSLVQLRVSLIFTKVWKSRWYFVTSKSSNVLLDPNFNAKLLDLGLAREGPKGTRLTYPQCLLGHTFKQGIGLTYSLEAARKIVKFADSCLRKNPDDRPAMSRIVDVLREVIRESENENNSQFGSRLPEPSARRMVNAA